DGPGSDPRRGLAGTRPAAAAIVADAVFGIVGEVGMARTVDVLDLGIVLRALVLVADHEADRRAGRPPLEDAGEDLDAIGLAALGRELRLARPAPVEPDLDLLGRQRQERGHAIHHDADRRAVALAPGGEAEQGSEA